MALPAGMMIVPAVGRAAEKGATIAQALLEAGSRPIISSRSVYGPEGLLAQERAFNFTPFGILAGAGALWMLGLAMAPRATTDEKGQPVVRMAVVERPRSLLPFAGRASYPDAAREAPAGTITGPLARFLNVAFKGPGGLYAPTY